MSDTNIFHLNYYWPMLRRDRFYLWLAYLLPRRLVYWCAIRVGSNATTKQYSGQVVPELSFVAAIERWG